MSKVQLLLDCRNTDPLLPALVEGLGLVHAVPVAAKVAAVPVVPVVAILVAKVATVTTSLVELVRGREGRDMMTSRMHRQTNHQSFRVLSAPQSGSGQDAETHLAGMSPVSAAVHVASTSSAHVPSVRREIGRAHV